MADRTRPTKHETSEPRAVINIGIEGDPPRYVATTPHAPSLRGEDPTHEHRAVNALVSAIRAYRAGYEARGEAVPWAPAGDKPPQGVSVLHLTGVSPPKTCPLTPAGRAVKSDAPGG